MIKKILFFISIFGALTNLYPLLSILLGLKFSVITFLFLFINSCSKDTPVPKELASTQYTLTINAWEGGTISPDANGKYNEGATITFTATPNEGYVFDRWEGSVNDNKPNGCWAGQPFLIYIHNIKLLNTKLLVPISSSIILLFLPFKSFCSSTLWYCLR